MKTLIVLVSLAVLAMTGSAHASVAYYEGFNYTAGTTLLSSGYYDGGSGGVWNNQAGSIAYTDLITSGNQAYTVTHGQSGTVISKLPAAVTSLFQSAGTFYVTFLANGNNAWLGLGMLDNVVTPTTLTDDVIVGQFSDVLEGGAYAERLILPGWGTGWVPTYSKLNLYALKIVNDGTAGADSVQLVRNPVLANGEPDWATESQISCTTANITGAVNGLRLSSFYYSGSETPREMFIDEIRIATTWEEAGVVPEPGSILALAMGIVGFGGLALRRRRG